MNHSGMQPLCVTDTGPWDIYTNLASLNHALYRIKRVTVYAKPGGLISYRYICFLLTLSILIILSVLNINSIWTIQSHGLSRLDVLWKAKQTLSMLLNDSSI